VFSARNQEGECFVSILAWLAVGLVAGLLARIIMPGGGPGGFILTVLLGMAGAVVGGLIAAAAGIGDGVTGFNLGTIIIATFGAVVLLALYRLVAGERGLRA
jgi:uncharacterized membrane protein YeaQ/YmgE (transglycosylase-associated protein family)